MVRRVAAASALVVGLILGGAIPAWAHVTLSPTSAEKGGSDVEIAFRVPNEEDAAITTKIDVAIPTDHPLASVLAQTVPGWTVNVQTTHLTKPIHTDDGDVNDAVSEVSWTAVTPADGIKPEEFGKFEIIAGQLPTDTNELTFKAIQTYSNGDVVRWIETETPGGPEADHPAPVLQLTAPSSPAVSATTEPAASSSPAATVSVVKKSDVDSARTIGIIAIIVGALGLAAGGAALASRRRQA